MVRVVGREQPVVIYEPLALDHGDAQVVAAAESFGKAYRRYRQRRFSDARAIVEKLHAARPEKLYEVYLERLAALEESPPDRDWDGVFVFKTK